MDRNAAAAEVKARYKEYLKPAKKRGYICPLCGNGTGVDGDGLSLDPKREGCKLHCFKCGFDGDLIDLYKQEHNCTTGEAFSALYDMFGIIVDGCDEPLTRKVSPATPHGEKIDEKPVKEDALAVDFTAYYADCEAGLSDGRVQAYLAARGIGAETAAKYHMGFDAKVGALIIPVSPSYYVSRAISDMQTRFMNPKGLHVEIFNVEALYADDANPVFVTEAALDALSIIEVGGEAISINGAGNTHKLMRALEERPTSRPIVLALDNDEAGEKATNKICSGLNMLGVNYMVRNLYGAHKDANEALVADRAQLEANVRNVSQVRTELAVSSLADFIVHDLFDEVESLRSQADRKTGFANLDAHAGAIYTGLYALGGGASVGKTSFSCQLADQMARLGHHVLFFSLEQSRLEIASKCIARTTAEMDKNAAMTALQIRLGDWPEHVIRAFDAFAEGAGRLFNVFEGSFNLTASEMRRVVEGYIEKHEVKPVVIVDYLQVMPADVDPATGRRITDKRAIVEYNATELKRMSHECDVPVIAISSLNRASYLAPIDFESFKETGGIEYTCDVLWGLQLSAINGEGFEGDDTKGKVRKRKLLAAAKERIPREIELVCLKNRFGACHYSCEFDYYPQYDLFIPKGN